MENKRRYNRRLLLFLIPGLLIATLFIIYNYYKYPFINKKVANTVAEKSNGLYSVQYESISINELSGSVELTNIRVIADTARQLRLIQQGDTSVGKMMVSAFIPKLRVLHFKTARALLMQQLVCEQIIIEQPQVTVHLYPGGPQYKNEKEPQQQLFRQILGNLKLIEAGIVEVKNSKVIAVDEIEKQTRFVAKQTNITLQQVRIDSAYYFDTTRTLFCKRIMFSSAYAVLGEGVKAASITALDFDTETKALHLGNFSYNMSSGNWSIASNASNVTMHGLEWKGPAEYSDLVLDRVDIGKISIEKKKSVNSEPKKEKQTPKPLLSGWIKRFSMNALNVHAVEYKSLKENDPAATFVNNSSLVIKKIFIDSTMQVGQSIWSSIKEMELINDRIEVTSKDKMYKFAAAGMKLNTKNKTFLIKELKVIPQYSESEFARRSKVQADRFSMTAKNIFASDINVDELFSGGFLCGKVVCGRSLLSVYHDMHYPPDTSSKLGKYPHQLLMSLNVPLKVKEFIANDFELHYRENSALSDSIGDVGFYKSKLRIDNIRNIEISPGDKTVATFSTSFMGVLPMQGAFVFDMGNWKNGNYQATADIGKTFQGSVLNSIMIPLGMGRIDKGIVHHLSCKVTADNYNINGTFNGLYEDLKISLLEKKKGNINKKTLTTIAANLLVKNNNKPGANSRVGKISAKRDISKTFFNFTWKSVFGGIRSLLGVKLK
jgi:hypothetical protein